MALAVEVQQATGVLDQLVDLRAVTAQPATQKADVAVCEVDVAVEVLHVAIAAVVVDEAAHEVVSPRAQLRAAHQQAATRSLLHPAANLRRSSLTATAISDSR